MHVNQGCYFRHRHRHFHNNHRYKTFKSRLLIISHQIARTLTRSMGFIKFISEQAGRQTILLERGLTSSEKM